MILITILKFYRNEYSNLSFLNSFIISIFLHYLLQIIEKLVDIVTHTHQAISEFLGNNGIYGIQNQLFLSTKMRVCVLIKEYFIPYFVKFQCMCVYFDLYNKLQFCMFTNYHLDFTGRS